MSSIDALQHKLDRIREQLEQRQHARTSYGRVILYNPATGHALPGQEPSETAIDVWIPDNSRDGYAKGVV